MSLYHDYRDAVARAVIGESTRPWQRLPHLVHRQFVILQAGIQINLDCRNLLTREGCGQGRTKRTENPNPPLEDINGCRGNKEVALFANKPLSPLASTPEIKQIATKGPANIQWVEERKLQRTQK